jgi:CRISPR/Cas system-associated exonuclease Cas4 (RecB family)
MLKEILEEHLKGQVREPRAHKDRLYPTASSAFINHTKYKRLEGKCMRAAYYSCLGMAEDVDFSSDRQMAMRLGEYTEDMVLDMVEKTGKLKSKGLKFDIPEYQIYGKLDAVFDYKGKDTGLEIKSIGSNRWTVGHIFGSDWNNPAPKWQNLFQTLVYCYAFRETIQQFCLFYIRRDTCETKEFMISIEPIGDVIYPVIDGRIDRRYTVSDILGRYKNLLDYINTDTTPPREFQAIYPREQLPTYAKLGILSKRQVENYDKEPFGDFECRFCGYKDICCKEK